MTRFTTALLLCLFVTTANIYAQESDGSTLWPYVLYTTVGSPSATAFEARDKDGQPIAGTLEFVEYDDTRISIDENGFVTGLVADTVDFNGTKVRATINGDTLSYHAHVRVLSQTYNFDFEELTGDNVVLYYPRSVGPDALEPLVDQYDMVSLLDVAYDVEEYLFQTVPDDSARQIVVVEPEEHYDFRHCRDLDNMLRLSYDVSGAVFQNCFMVPYIQGGSPRMDVVYHEFGHAFQDEATVYLRALDGEFLYREGLADLLFTGVPQLIAEEPVLFPLSADSREAVQAVADFKIDQQNGRYDDWVAGGALFAELNSNIVHGIILHHRETRSIEFYQRFFYALQSEFETDLNEVLESVENLGATGRHSFFVALLGAVIKVDLSPTFVDDYHYVIDQTLHDAAFDKITQILDASIFTSTDDLPGLAGPDAIVTDIFPNPARNNATISIERSSVDNLKVEVFDLLGRQVMEPVTISGASPKVDLSVDLTGLTNGIYLYRVGTSKESVAGKFVIVR